MVIFCESCLYVFTTLIRIQKNLATFAGSEFIFLKDSNFRECSIYFIFSLKNYDEAGTGLELKIC